MAKVIMIQGTMSNVGKSLVAAGLCRVFKNDGYRVAPFKSQNMALNSFVTKDGLEMGRAQVMQAEAAGIEPDVCMNPILLKPTGDMRSQVIVHGEVVGNMDAREYFEYRKNLVSDVLKAFRRLEERAEIIVVEGAGSPAEINLKDGDIVNMGLAKMLSAPVLLVGDIDRGGVFAQLLGTLMLLEKEERKFVKGFVINKFRGDRTILEPGIEMLEARAGVPVRGVIPYANLALDDEDSLTARFDRKEKKAIDIAVIRYPRISNFTDMNVFEHMDGVSVRYVASASKLGAPDMIVLPGSKNTMGDLRWIKETNLASEVIRLSGEIPIFGICGGYQMLGTEISDPHGVEDGGYEEGLGLLPLRTTLKNKKERRQIQGRFGEVSGAFSSLSGAEYAGYEIHMGATHFDDGSEPPVLTCLGNVYGTYVHSVFDNGSIAGEVVNALARRKGVLGFSARTDGYGAIKEREYDKLERLIREHMDMDAIYATLSEASL